MLGFTERRNLYGSFTLDTSTENLSLGDTLINEAEKRILNAHAWPFLQKDATDTTVASQQFYDLPFNYRKLISKPTITISGTQHTPLEAPNTEFWNRLNTTTPTSDIPLFFFIFDGKIGFFPTPATSSNSIKIPYEIMQKDLSIADYVTGTIAGVTNGDATVTGTSTAWTSAFVGRFIKITADNTADSGDNEWYEIASITSTTELELVKKYQGTTFSSATQAYIASEMSVLPDGYDMLPVYKAAENYHVTNENPGRADRFKQQYDELLNQLLTDQGLKLSNLVVDDIGLSIENQNLFLTL